MAELQFMWCLTWSELLVLGYNPSQSKYVINGNYINVLEYITQIFTLWVALHAMATSAGFFPPWLDHILTNFCDDTTAVSWMNHTLPNSCPSIHHVCCYTSILLAWSQQCSIHVQTKHILGIQNQEDNFLSCYHNGWTPMWATITSVSGALIKCWIHRIPSAVVSLLQSSHIAPQTAAMYKTAMIKLSSPVGSFFHLACIPPIQLA